MENLSWFCVGKTKRFKIVCEQLAVSESQPTLRIWHPSAECLTLILGAVKLQDQPLVIEAIVDSMQRCSFSIEEFAKQRALEEPSSYTQARRNLREFNERPAFLRSAKAASHQYELYRRAYGKTFVEPLLEQAVRESDPLRRTLLRYAGELAEVAGEACPLVQSARAVAARRADAGETITEAIDNRRLEAADAFLQVVQRLNRPR